MNIHCEQLTDVCRYLQNNGQFSLADKEAAFRAWIRAIERFRKLRPNTRLLEIGTGTGWFNILCRARGINAKGIEISPQLVQFAQELGRENGTEADIQLGNIENCEIERSCYDVIIAYSVFEHVEHWETALRRVFRALKPGGVFFFSSTNKFSFTSGEFKFPLYGWLPDRWRYRLRILTQGPDIMKLGIDFNQFTYPGLRRAFRQAGFSRVLDRVEAADFENVNSSWKRGVLKACQRSPLVKHFVLTFCDSTVFVCIK